MDEPLRFHPYLRPMVWGGRRLGDVLGKPLPDETTYGEAWEVSDHASHHSIVSTGPFAGNTLRHLMEREPDALLGSAASSHQLFPWLVKLLDACDWLSVQVHPDDEDVLEHWPGECGKTEVWFVLDAAPGSRIYAGLLPGVDESVLRKALLAGTVLDVLHQFEPRPGDCVFLPAGTVHAVGGGVLMAEVQQTSDATFRLFDWNRRDAQGRSRKLHIEQSLAVIDWDRGPVYPVRPAGYPTQINQHFPKERVRQRLVNCPYFQLDYWRENAPFDLGGTGRLQVAIVVHGRATLTTFHGGHAPLTLGETILLPASVPARTVEPDGTVGMLVATL